MVNLISINFALIQFLILYHLEFNERLTDILSQNVFILYFMIGLILIAWLLVLDRKKIKSYFGAFIGARIVDQLERSDYEKSSRLNIVARLLYFANVSLLFYKLVEMKLYSTIYSGIGMWGLIFAAVIFWYLIKYTIVLFVCWIFKINELAKENVFHNQINSIVISFVLFPLLLVSHYQNIISELFFIYTSFIFLLISAAIKSKRIFALSINRFNLSLYHNILYICTLEILPLIVLIKFLIDTI